MNDSLKTSKYSFYLENENIFFLKHLHSIQKHTRKKLINNILLLEKYWTKAVPGTKNIYWDLAQL